MKKKIFGLFILSLSCIMMFSGCVEKIADTPEILVKQALNSKDLDTFYGYSIQGVKPLEYMTDTERSESETVLNNLKKEYENNKDNLELKVLQDDTEGKYTRVAMVKKGSNIKNEANIQFFYVVKSNNEYKLDLSIAEANEINLVNYEVDYLAYKDKDINFKVYAKLSDKYNYEFKDKKDEYYSIEITESNSVSKFYGYIKKDSEDGKKLYNLLDGYEKRQVTFKLSIPEWVQVNRDVFLIEKLASTNWGID
ncbi:MAG: hypothetical protein GX275_06285 [Clostridiales bacterium]|nr:hypothetical protein [Clostridiales bacterium]